MKQDIQIIRPVFERRDGITPANPPATAAEFDQLKTLSDEELKAKGLKHWTEQPNLWLFPKEWYAAIPAGYPIIYIDGQPDIFRPDKTSEDYRSGVLAYGIVAQR